MHISQIEPWTFFAKQNRKRKNNWQFVWKVNLYWFLNFPVNRRLWTRGWRPSKRTPPNNIEFIQFWKGKQNNYVKNNPTGFQLCYRLYVFKRLITLLLSWRWSWLIDAVWTWQLIPDSGCKVIQWDIVLRFNPQLFPGPPFRVFSPPGYPFLPKPPFQVFDLPGVQIFHFIPHFARTLLVRREALIFA